MGQTPLYEHVGESMLMKAQDGQYKPLIGRERELDTLIEVLNRKEKANPVLIGEAGVGKTAIIEGLAQRIDSGDVPIKLQDVELMELKIGKLETIANKYGSMEFAVDELCKSVIDSDKTILLFIDEIHAITKKGPLGLSMAEAFKPYLARGEVRLIGSTTRVEYKQIEDDKAVERRFTPIFVEEPSFNDTVTILQGVKELYEGYHEVNYLEDTIPYIIKASQRYMTDRVLPDKALDLLDVVGAKRNLTFEAVDVATYDAEIEDKERNLSYLITQEQFTEGFVVRQEILQLNRDRDEYIEAQKENRNINISVLDVKNILSDHLNVEVEIDLEVDEEVDRLRQFETRLNEAVIGQEPAVHKVADAIISHRLGLRNPDKPVGTFLFHGPSGVGKTELAKQVSQLMFGSEDNLLRIDMGEYQESHTISKLLGSPSGYIGYGNGKTAFEPIRRNPSQVILVDEIEKAAPNIQNVFLSILDEGFVTDQENNKINFRESIIIFTTNAKPTSDSSIKQIGFSQVGQSLEELVPRFAEFRPEFVNRFDAIVGFNEMTEDMLGLILNLRIKDLNKRFQDRGYTVNLTNEVKTKLIKDSMDKGMGARPLNRNLTQLVEGKMKEELLSGRDTKVFNFDLLNNQYVLTEDNIDLNINIDMDELGNLTPFTKSNPNTNTTTQSGTTN